LLNVDVKTDKGKITITIDSTKDFGPSKSGKTTIIASTQGNQKITVGKEEMVLGLNVYKSRQI